MSGKAAGLSAGRQNSVAWNYERNRVAAHSLSHGSGCVRITQRSDKVSIRSCLAGRNGLCGLIDDAGKFRDADEGQWNVAEVLNRSTEVFLDLLYDSRDGGWWIAWPFGVGVRRNSGGG